MWTWKRNQVYLKQKQEKNLHTEKTSLLKCKDQDTDTRTRSKLMKHRNVWWSAIISHGVRVCRSLGPLSLTPLLFTGNLETAVRLSVKVTPAGGLIFWLVSLAVLVCRLVSWQRGDRRRRGGLLLCFYFFRVGGWGAAAYARLCCQPACAPHHLACRLPSSSQSRQKIFWAPRQVWVLLKPGVRGQSAAEGRARH